MSGGPAALRMRAAAAAYRFRESLFGLPALIVLGSIVLAEAAAAVDRTAGARGLPFTMTMSSSTATWLLSTVAGATITTAGVVFSLTVVSLQLASSQFSPRVMRSFIRDRLSQVVIGALTATFVYCVLILRNVDGDSSDSAPRISLTAAVVLTVVTVLLIVAHLDHLAHSLQVGRVVERIGAESQKVVAATVRAGAAERPAPARLPATCQPSVTVPATRDGWVTQAPTDRLLAAVGPGTSVRLETRPGAYVHAGEPLVAVWPAPVDARVLRRLSAAVFVSDTRTMQCDVDFALRQLVDIGLRALSAAINDPTTAVEVTLRVGSLLRRLLIVPDAADAVAGRGGRLLLRPWALSGDELIAHGFDQLRHAAPAQPQVAAALLRVARMLIAHVQAAGRSEHVPALRRQIDLLLEALRSTPGLHRADLARLEAIATDADPADHSRRWAPASPATADVPLLNGHRSPAGPS